MTLNDAVFHQYFTLLKERFNKYWSEAATIEWLELLYEHNVTDEEFIAICRSLFRSERPIDPKEFPLPYQFVDLVARLRVHPAEESSESSPPPKAWKSMTPQERQESQAAINAVKAKLGNMTRGTTTPPDRMASIGALLSVVPDSPSPPSLAEIVQRQRRWLHGDDQILAKAALEWAYQHPDVEVFLDEQDQPDMRLKQDLECA